MPFSDLKPFRYRLFKDGKQTRDLTFYGRDRAHADRNAIAWIKKHPDETIKRLKPKS